MKKSIKISLKPFRGQRARQGTRTKTPENTEQEFSADTNVSNAPDTEQTENAEQETSERSRKKKKGIIGRAASRQAKFDAKFDNMSSISQVGWILGFVIGITFILFLGATLSAWWLKNASWLKGTSGEWLMEVSPTSLLPFLSSAVSVFSLLFTPLVSDRLKKQYLYIKPLKLFKEKDEDGYRSLRAEVTNTSKMWIEPAIYVVIIVKGKLKDLSSEEKRIWGTEEYTFPEHLPGKEKVNFRDYLVRIVREELKEEKSQEEGNCPASEQKQDLIERVEKLEEKVYDSTQWRCRFRPLTKISPPLLKRIAPGRTVADEVELPSKAGRYEAHLFGILRDGTLVGIESTMFGSDGDRRRKNKERDHIVKGWGLSSLWSRFRGGGV